MVQDRLQTRGYPHWTFTKTSKKTSKSPAQKAPLWLTAGAVLLPSRQAALLRSEPARKTLIYLQKKSCGSISAFSKDELARIRSIFSSKGLFFKRLCAEDVVVAEVLPGGPPLAGQPQWKVSLSGGVSG